MVYIARHGTEGVKESPFPWQINHTARSSAKTLTTYNLQAIPPLTFLNNLQQPHQISWQTLAPQQPSKTPNSRRQLQRELCKQVLDCLGNSYKYFRTAPPSQITA